MKRETSSVEKPSTKPKTIRWWGLSPGIWIGYFLGGGLCITCFWIAFEMPPAHEWWLNLLLCLFGLVLGWTIGVLLSPMSKIEETMFTTYGKALSVFLTGFVVAKFDLLLKNIHFTVTDPAELIVPGGRILLFAAMLVTGFQFTFMARLPKAPDDGQRKRPRTFLRTKFKV
jgi:uncharacterized membrane protein